MANELDYVLRMNATAFTGPLRGALGDVRQVENATKQMGASVDGMRTSLDSAGAASQSLFGKLAQLGGNLANVVSGVKAANEVVGFLRTRSLEAAAANTTLAATSTTAATASAGLGVAGRAAGAGLGFMGAAAGGAAVGVGAVMTAMVALAPVVAGVAAAFAAVGATFKGVSLAANLEQDLIKFQTLTGSMDQAKATLQELRGLAAETPFQLPDLSEAAGILLNAKVPAGALKAEMKALGNIASVSGSSVSRLAMIYSQVAGKGQVYMEELRQFQEAGASGITDSLAKTMGVTTSQLNEMMSKGKVGFSELQKAMQNLAGETGVLGKAMEMQSKTTWGLLSTLKDNVGEVMMAFGQPVNDGPVKEALNSMIGLAQWAAKVIPAAIQKGQIGESLSNALTLGAKLGANAVIDAIASIPGKVRPFLQSIGDAVLGALSGNFEAIKRLGEFDLGTMRFDTGSETAFFEKLVQQASVAGGEAAKGYNANWAKERDTVSPPETAGTKSEGGDKGQEAELKKKAGFRQALDTMLEELAILDARAKGENAVADAIQARVSLAKEVAEIMKSTGVSEAEAVALAERRLAAQKAIADAAINEAAAKKAGAAALEAQSKKDEESKAADEKAQGYAKSIQALKEEMAILQAKATGQTDLAAALERESSVRQEAKRIAEATGVSEEQALQLARDKAALQERANRSSEGNSNNRAGKDSRYGEDGRRLSDGRKKIMGFSRNEAGLKPFGGPGLLQGFRGAVAGASKVQTPGRAPGIVPPGVASRAQQRKEAERAAEKSVQPRWDLVEAIEQRLASLGLV